MNGSRKKFVKELNTQVDWVNLFVLFPASFFISNRFSPYLSYWYVKKKIIPNAITIHMILAGILGGIMFSIPNIFIKFLGAVVIHLWFIIDCSDGEVARYTKQFSKFGGELDYLAHMIDHPFFCISFIFSLIQLDRYSPLFIVILVLTSLFMDSTIRNLITLEKFTNDSSKTIIETNKTSKLNIVNILKMIFNTFLFFPNVVLFGVIIYFIDYYLGTDLLVYLIMGNILTSFIIILKKLKVKLAQYYHS